jgi:hypothetical protein
METCTYLDTVADKVSVFHSCVTHDVHFNTCLIQKKKVKLMTGVKFPTKKMLKQIYTDNPQVSQNR